MRRFLTAILVLCAVSIPLLVRAGEPVLSGITFDPLRPDVVRFVLDGGNGDPAQMRIAAERYARYFFAALTVPESGQWVNLSPDLFEETISADLAQTDLGIDMLSQDLALKRTVAAAVDPRTPGGAAYQRARGKDVATALQKVWIEPGHADLETFTSGALIESADLSVRGEEEAFAVLAPDVTRAVNESPTFFAVRQMYRAAVLASWCRRSGLLSVPMRSFVDTSSVDGLVKASGGEETALYRAYCAEVAKADEPRAVRVMTPDGRIAKAMFAAGGASWAKVASAISLHPSSSSSIPPRTGRAMFDVVCSWLRLGKSTDLDEAVSAFYDPNQYTKRERDAFYALRQEAKWFFEQPEPTDLVAGQYLVMWVGKRPVGFIEFRGDYRLGSSLEKIYVTPAARKSRVGERLFVAALRALTDAGIPTWSVSDVIDERPAQRFHAWIIERYGVTDVDRKGKRILSYRIDVADAMARAASGFVARTSDATDDAKGGIILSGDGSGSHVAGSSVSGVSFSVTRSAG